MAISKEAKVGLLALVAGVILYVGFNFLKGFELFSDNNQYFIMYEEIDGLAVSNPVQVNGLSVGRVESIELLPEKGNALLVSIMVDEKVPVGDSTYALLANTDLLGGKSIELQIGNNTTLFDGGDTLRGVKKVEVTEALTEKALPILTNIDSTVVKLNKVFGDELGESIGTTVHNLEIASSDLRQMVSANRRNIEATTSNLAELTASLTETEKQLKPVLTKMNMLADSLNDLELKETVRNANQTMQNLQEVTAKINEKEGSLGLLINDKELYQNLNSTVKDLDKLVQDIEENPKKYLKISVF